MSKIFGFYTKDGNGTDVDKTWYESSNVKYSECQDHDNELKTLKVVFSNGSQYQYNKVNVNDYLLFREDASQGKALNKYIKAGGYEYEKLDNVDVSELDDELLFRETGGIFIRVKDNGFDLLSNTDSVLYSTDKEVSDDMIEVMKALLEAVGKKVRIIENNK